MQSHAYALLAPVRYSPATPQRILHFCGSLPGRPGRPRAKHKQPAAAHPGTARARRHAFRPCGGRGARQRPVLNPHLSRKGCGRGRVRRGEEETLREEKGEKSSSLIPAAPLHPERYDRLMKGRWELWTHARGSGTEIRCVHGNRWGPTAPADLPSVRTDAPCCVMRRTNAAIARDWSVLAGRGCPGSPWCTGMPGNRPGRPAGSQAPRQPDR